MNVLFGGQVAGGFFLQECERCVAGADRPAVREAGHPDLLLLSPSDGRHPDRTQPGAGQFPAGAEHRLQPCRDAKRHAETANGMPWHAHGILPGMR